MATKQERGGAIGAYGRTVEATTTPSPTFDSEGAQKRAAARRKAQRAGATRQQLDRVRDNAVTRALRKIGIDC